MPDATFQNFYQIGNDDDRYNLASFAGRGGEEALEYYAEVQGYDYADGILNVNGSFYHYPNGRPYTVDDGIAYDGYFYEMQNGAARWLDWTQGGLDVVGVFDPFGVADGINALIYAGRGNYVAAGVSAAAMIPYIGDLAKVGKYAVKAAKRAVKVEQYTLRAAADGFYSVMKRGFKNGQELTWLNKGDIWKVGTTMFPKTRYLRSFLRNTGSGLEYAREFAGTRTEALIVERMKILNYMEVWGYLPAGNKIIR